LEMDTADLNEPLTLYTERIPCNGCENSIANDDRQWDVAYTFVNQREVTNRIGPVILDQHHRIRIAGIELTVAQVDQTNLINNQNNGPALDFHDLLEETRFRLGL